jgi:HAD superfamily hydrolase (TIGR01509 family)
MQIKGLVFDFDGLILDTEAEEYKSWKDVFNSFNLELPFNEWALCVGTSNKDFDVYEYFEKKVGNIPNKEEIYKRREEKLLQRIATLSPLPGICDLLIEAKKLNIKVALASSSSHQWVTPHLDRLGMINYFHSIHTCEEVQEVKPDPAIYINAIKALGLAPEEAVAFEDSPNGIKAAKEAGLYCVAVPNQVTIMMDTSQADLVLPTLKGVTISKIIELLDKLPLSV